MTQGYMPGVGRVGYDNSQLLNTMMMLAKMRELKEDRETRYGLAKERLDIQKRADAEKQRVFDIEKTTGLKISPEMERYWENPPSSRRSIVPSITGNYTRPDVESFREGTEEFVEAKPFIPPQSPGALVNEPISKATGRSLLPKTIREDAEREGRALGLRREEMEAITGGILTPPSEVLKRIEAYNKMKKGSSERQYEEDTQSARVKQEVEKGIRAPAETRLKFAEADRAELALDTETRIQNDRIAQEYYKTEEAKAKNANFPLDKEKLDLEVKQLRANLDKMSVEQKKAEQINRWTDHFFGAFDSNNQTEMWRAANAISALQGKPFEGMEQQRKEAELGISRTTLDARLFMDQIQTSQQISQAKARALGSLNDQNLPDDATRAAKANAELQEANNMSVQVARRQKSPTVSLTTVVQPSTWTGSAGKPAIVSMTLPTEIAHAISSGEITKILQDPGVSLEVRAAAANYYAKYKAGSEDSKVWHRVLDQLSLPSEVKNAAKTFKTLAVTPTKTGPTATETKSALKTLKPPTVESVVEEHKEKREEAIGIKTPSTVPSQPIQLEPGIFGKPETEKSLPFKKPLQSIKPVPKVEKSNANNTLAQEAVNSEMMTTLRTAVLEAFNRGVETPVTLPERIADFARKNNRDPDSITMAEIRDIYKSGYDK
jgi:hypothetical protein